MIRQIVAAIAAATLLTACGGETEPPKSKPTPTPRTYTIEELKAALPDQDDVAGVSRVEYTCPDKVRCPAPDEGEMGGINFALLPAGDNPADIERAANESLFGNTLLLYVWRHQGSAEATKENEAALAQDKTYDGAYDVKQKGDVKTGATPADKGEGALEMLEIGAWKGHFVERRGSMTFQDTTERRLIASVEVVQGSVTFSIDVNVHADGRPADFADKLARKTLTDYLKRLG